MKRAKCLLLQHSTVAGCAGRKSYWCQFGLSESVFVSLQRQAPSSIAVVCASADVQILGAGGFSGRAPTHAAVQLRWSKPLRSTKA